MEASINHVFRVIDLVGHSQQEDQANRLIGFGVPCEFRASANSYAGFVRVL